MELCHSLSPSFLRDLDRNNSKEGFEGLHGTFAFLRASVSRDAKWMLGVDLQAMQLGALRSYDGLRRPLRE